MKIRSRKVGLAAGYEYEQYGFHRGQLQLLLYQELIARVPVDSVVLNTKLVSFEDTTSGVKIQTKPANEPESQDVTTYEADVLIAADGIHSAVRKVYYGDEKPSFTGWVIWRGAMPIERWPEHIPLKDVVTYGHSDAYMAWYPFRKDEAGKETLVNWGACIKVAEQGDVAESWAQQGKKEEIEEHFGAWPEPCGQIISRTDKIMKLSIHDRDPVKAWAFGRVLLIGDAAHPMLPFAGQGASSAMEDGWLLAQVLGDLAPEASQEEIASALKSVEAQRIEHVTKVTLHCRNRGGILEEFVVVDQLKAKSDAELKELLDSKQVDYSACNNSRDLLIKVLDQKDVWPESFLRKLY